MPRQRVCWSFRALKSDVSVVYVIQESGDQTSWRSHFGLRQPAAAFRPNSLLFGPDAEGSMGNSGGCPRQLDVVDSAMEAEMRGLLSAAL
jgi:hypothetical protein